MCISNHGSEIGIVSSHLKDSKQEGFEQREQKGYKVLKTQQENLQKALNHESRVSQLLNSHLRYGSSKRATKP